MEALDLSWARSADALRQATFIEAKGEFIAAGGGEIGQTIVQLQHKSGSHQGSDGDCRIATLQPPEGVAADEKTGRHVAGGKTALPTRKREIAAQFAKRVSGRQWHGVWLRHDDIVLYLRHYVNMRLVYRTLFLLPLHMKQGGTIVADPDGKTPRIWGWVLPCLVEQKFVC
jgi:hypothetical protein